MKKFVILCLAAAGIAGLPLNRADAHQTATPVAVSTNQAIAALPATARVNLTVVVGAGRPHRYHRSYRTVRRVYYRHGRRVVVYRRIYY